jgi:hypothetical protein
VPTLTFDPRTDHQALLEGAATLLALLDASTQRLMAGNRAFAALIGVQEAELPGLDLLRYNDEDERTLAGHMLATTWGSSCPGSAAAPRSC